MRKRIILGIGILIILLALAGTGSAKYQYGFGCSFCHPGGSPPTLTANGTVFNETHKFDGVAKPSDAASCSACHINPSSSNFGLNAKGQNYSDRHNGINSPGYIMSGVNCSYCHTDPVNGTFTFLPAGTRYNQTHKFAGVNIPRNATNCVTCHTDVNVFMPLTLKGPFYNATHRYNGTTLSSELLPPQGCYNCHVDNGSNFAYLISDSPTFMTSSVCEDCHKKKYDDWYGTMHRVMLSTNTSAAEMGLPLPPGWDWSNVTYVVVGKAAFRYLNETGGIFQEYNVTNKSFNSPKKPGNYTCGGCHTTGYNATGGNQSGLPGIVGTWSEEGIACENCHGPGGNGHNVTVYAKGEDCIKCHDGTNRQGPAMTNRHKTAPAEESTNPSCTFCHSPYDNYTRGAAASLDTAANITCSVCHNPHGTSDDKYNELMKPGGFNADNMAVVGEVKLSFFNATASNISATGGVTSTLTAGNDVYNTLMTPALLYPGSISSRKDSSYGTGPINVTGPASEVLCSMCHYRHGLQHIAGVNLTHARAFSSNITKWATCTDCHMSGSNADHSFNAGSETNYPAKTCSRGTECHITSSQNLSASSYSIVPVEREWAASMHNDKANGYYKNASYFANSSRKNSSCSKCHSPFNWNPANESGIVDAADFKGITCAVCHNIHDMGDSITNSGKVYSWYNRDAIKSGSRYKANYTLMANTTELCGNCHSNIRIGNTGPGWSSATATTPISPHGWPAKDVFVGSFKESGLNFECIDCHMYKNVTNATGGILNDTEKISGHSFKVNATGLQNTSKCNYCHVNGSKGVDTIPNVIARIQADTHTKWNATNTTVRGALTTINAYTGIKNLSRDRIAEAYWKMRLVSSDSSWGVHDPVGINKLLDDATALANAANESLGLGISNIDLHTGWNDVALNGIPSVTAPVSVFSSVSGNITVVWSFNATSQTWELYDPVMPSELQTLKTVVPGKGYWINAIADCKWIV